MQCLDIRESLAHSLSVIMRMEAITENYKPVLDFSKKYISS